MSRWNVFVFGGHYRVQKCHHLIGVLGRRQYFSYGGLEVQLEAAVYSGV